MSHLLARFEPDSSSGVAPLLGHLLSNVEELVAVVVDCFP